MKQIDGNGRRRNVEVMRKREPNGKKGVYVESERDQLIKRDMRRGSGGNKTIYSGMCANRRGDLLVFER